ncbi:MAG: hypothetical protein RL018_813, partial [Pseudomonadota bacterium]
MKLASQKLKMNDANTKTLLTCHPKLLRHLDEWGFQCGDGWFDLLANLFADIDAVAKKTSLQGTDSWPAIYAVKQKMGTLTVRSEFGVVEHQADELTKAAAQWSGSICELCGEAGTLARRHYGVQALCELHSADNPPHDLSVVRPSAASKMPRPLSKSKLIAYRQCPKRLWLEIHHPELRADNAATQAVFATGHKVGALAQSIFDPAGAGYLVDMQALGVAGAIAQTQSLVLASSPHPIFEAGFKADTSGDGG